jgi:hypothetical protein
VITPDDLVPATNDWKRYGDDVGEARRVAKAAGRRTAATRDRRSLAKVGAAAGRQ